MIIEAYYVFCGLKMVIFPYNLLIMKFVFHVFGGTSSPFCSNYALRKTSVDGEDQNNIYIDDLLKSGMMKIKP